MTAAKAKVARVPRDENATAAPLVPDTRDLRRVRDAARGCLACPAGLLGTQTVFGAGPRSARLFLIGEQPGNEEDLSGKPFVGPAGRLLDKALEAAEVPRDEVYVTNAVKHFSYVWRGKRRIHAKPSLRVVRACRPWLEAELHSVAPRVVMCLGATAAQSLMGSRFGVLQNRGQAFQSQWGTLTVTYHPSALLRMEDAPRREAFDQLVSDLRFAYGLATSAP
ncbi:MAG TPA: UdgX family uracil-DNA binding protein [Polyangiales bacterium]|nr:UdgX family uracil-DNA binding protein [Polyangiales bacterium]